MNKLHIEVDNTHQVVLDIQSGEVLYYIYKGEYSPTLNSPSKYREGMEEVSLLTPDDMKSWMDKSKCWVLAEDGLSDLVISAHLTERELKVFMALGKNTFYLNRVYTTIPEVATLTSMQQSHISSCIKSLTKKGFIRLVSKNTFGVGSRVIDIHPMYFWKGDYGLRWVYRQNWVKINVAPLEERLYSCPILNK